MTLQPSKVSACDWLGLRAQPPAALSVPPKQRIGTHRTSRPLKEVMQCDKGADRMEKLRWRVLLLAGEHGNMSNTRNAEVMEQPRPPRASDESPRSSRPASATVVHSTTVLPFWASSVRVTSAAPHQPVRDHQGSLSPRQTVASQASAPLASSGPVVANESSRRRRHRNGQVVPVTAVFSKENGVFLHDTLPRPPADTPTVADTKTVTGQQTCPLDTAPPPRGTVAPQPPVRDIQTIKRLIRLVQVETGESQFRAPMDAKVLQSLIPTATMHMRQSHQEAQAHERRQQRPSTAAATANRLSPQRSRPAPPELATAVVGTSTTGDLALGVHTAPSACRATRADEAAKDRRNPDVRGCESPKLPRPQSARVSRPTFSFQRMFDGYATLEHWQSPGSGQSPKFVQYSGETIPVVGRR